MSSQHVRNWLERGLGFRVQGFGLNVEGSGFREGGRDSGWGIHKPCVHTGESKHHSRMLSGRTCGAPLGVGSFHKSPET